MDFEDYKRLISKTRATRRFKENIFIDNEELKEVINIARIASSSKNMQALKYITVTSKKLVKKLSQTCKWAVHLKDWNQSEDEQPSAFIIILNDTTIDAFAMFDCGIALSSITLGLKVKGYSTCPLASIDKKVCEELFNLPQHLEPFLGVAVGVENETINIVNVEKDTNYYRNEKNEHCIPKRSLEDVLVGSF